MPVLHQLLKPVRLSFVISSLIAALLLNFIPWSGTLYLLLPDFVGLVLLYWLMNQPKLVNLSWCFLLGLLLDIANANVFGQHSLAYCFSGYLVLIRHRQLAMFAFGLQALYVGGLLLINQLIMLMIRLLSHTAVFPGWLYFANAIIGALIWPLLSQLLQLPQRATDKSAEL